LQNKIEDLRNHLFATLEGLRDKDAPMEIDRAKAVSQVAQVIIETAKVECKYLELGGTLKSQFISGDDMLPAPAKAQTRRIGNAG
jgi:hypothetical protein